MISQLISNSCVGRANHRFPRRTLISQKPPTDFHHIGHRDHLTQIQDARYICYDIQQQSPFASWAAVFRGIRLRHFSCIAQVGKDVSRTLYK